MHPDKRRAGRRIRKQQRLRRRFYDLSRRIPVSFGAISVALTAFSGALRAGAAQEEEFARKVAAAFSEPWHHDYGKEER